MHCLWGNLYIGGERLFYKHRLRAMQSWRPRFATVVVKVLDLIALHLTRGLERPPIDGEQLQLTIFASGFTEFLLAQLIRRNLNTSYIALEIHRRYY